MWITLLEVKLLLLEWLLLQLGCSLATPIRKAAPILSSLFHDTGTKSLDFTFVKLPLLP